MYTTGTYQTEGGVGLPWDQLTLPNDLFQLFGLFIILELNSIYFFNTSEKNYLMLLLNAFITLSQQKDCLLYKILSCRACNL